MPSLEQKSANYTFLVYLSYSLLGGQRLVTDAGLAL